MKLKLPRSFQITILMAAVIRSIMHNERLTLKASLSRLNDLGGIYIKFLQIIVLNLNSQDQENFSDLLSVYEHSKPDNLDLEGYLRHRGYNKLDGFTEIETKPFATGSFGQVYHAKLKDGTAVIIKVLRPSVMKYLHSDLRLLSMLSWTYNLFDRQRLLNFRQIFGELHKSCLNETNYLNEAQLAEQYYQRYKDHPTFVIPQTYLDLSNNYLIVQDFVDGLSVAELMRHQAAGTEPIAYVREVLGSDLYAQLHTVGFELLSKATIGEVLQADPHPGNIILLPQNKVALIDFGMATELAENRTAFYEMILQYQAYYANEWTLENFAMSALKYLAPEFFAAIGAADKLFAQEGQSAKTSGPKLMERLRHATMEVAEDRYTAQLIDTLLERRMIMKVLFFGVNRGNRFGFSFDLKSITLLKAGQTYLSMLGQFDHQATIIKGVINDVVTFSQANLDKIIGEKPIELSPHEALEILSTWFDKMARADPWLASTLVGGYVE